MWGEGGEREERRLAKEALRMDDTPGVLAQECQLGKLNIVPQAYACMGRRRSRAEPAAVWQPPDGRGVEVSS